MKPDPKRSHNALRALEQAAAASRQLKVEIERAQAREQRPTLRDPRRRVRRRPA